MNTETKVTGKKYRVCTDATNKNYDRYSYWTDASDVEFDDGTDAKTNLGNIKGITDSLASTSSNIALSAKAGKELTESLATTTSKFTAVLDEYYFTASFNEIKKKDNLVNFQCNLAVAKLVSSGNHPLTIPSGYRPSSNRLVQVTCASDTSKSIYAIISTNGRVTIYGNLVANCGYFISGEYLQ